MGSGGHKESGLLGNISACSVHVRSWETKWDVRGMAFTVVDV